jgi:hypothetical protein
MRLALLLAAVAATCVLASAADARAGRGFKGGFRSPSGPSVPQAQPSRVGVGVGVVVPVGTERRGTGATAQPRYVLPLPARPPEDPEAPRFHSASAESVETGPKREASARPWCDNGQVVGRGAGFCDLTPAQDRRGAPALLALSN